jgi:hypothetical protein
MTRTYEERRRSLFRGEKELRPLLLPIVSLTPGGVSP